MKIKTKSGEIIDLADIRTFIAEGDARPEESWAHIEVLNDYAIALLDALEAALSIGYNSDLGEEAAVGWEMFHGELHKVVGHVNPQTGRTQR